MAEPLVSVIMPAYNAEMFIEEAIKSIINQTHTNWELFVMEDGSTDHTLSIAKKFSSNKISIHSSGNQGQAAQLNQGIKLARGKYLAIAHADDYCAHERLAEQVALLENNERIGICGSNIQLIGQKNKRISFPVNPTRCYLSLYVGNPLAHSAVMIRTDLLRASGLFYDPKLKAAEDYDLWIRLSEFTQISNVNNSLVSYRVHDQQLSQTHRALEESVVLKSRERLLTQLFPKNTVHYFNLFNFLYLPKKVEAFKNWDIANDFRHALLKRKALEQAVVNNFILEILCRNLKSIPFLQRLKSVVHLPKSFFLWGFPNTFILIRRLYLSRSR